MKILRKEDLKRVGFVNKTSGFKGSLSCVIEIARPSAILKKKFLFLILEGLPVPFAIEEMELNGETLKVKFEDVDSEEQAKKLVRKEIFADKIKDAKQDDYFTWHDLVGYSVTDKTHGSLGNIEDVFEQPMQMIARCTFKGKEILFPLNDDVVIEINEQKKQVFVELPDGLLDVYL